MRRHPVPAIYSASLYTGKRPSWLSEFFQRCFQSSQDLGHNGGCRPREIPSSVNVTKQHFQPFHVFLGKAAFKLGPLIALFHTFIGPKRVENGHLFCWRQWLVLHLVLTLVLVLWRPGLVVRLCSDGSWKLAELCQQVLLYGAHFASSVCPFQL